MVEKGFRHDNEPARFNGVVDNNRLVIPNEEGIDVVTNSLRPIASEFSLLAANGIVAQRVAVPLTASLSPDSDEYARLVAVSRYGAAAASFAIAAAGLVHEYVKQDSSAKKTIMIDTQNKTKTTSLSVPVRNASQYACAESLAGFDEDTFVNRVELSFTQPAGTELGTWGSTSEITVSAVASNPLDVRQVSRRASARVTASFESDQDGRTGRGRTIEVHGGYTHDALSKPTTNGFLLLEQFVDVLHSAL